MVKFSVRKPLTVFVAVLAIIIVGIVAYFNMTPDLLPNMDFPYVVIMTTDPGASPETVEEEITKPMEESMATLEHIKKITSTSSENYSVVILQFESDVNMDTIGVDIQQNISSLSAGWDDTVGTPYVMKINPSVLPVDVLAVSMEDTDITKVSQFVDDTLLGKLEGVTGVASVTSLGSITNEVHVVVSQDKIDAVNRRMADAVNQQLDDAKAELEETKAELADAQAQLDEAQAQVDSGEDTLVNQTAAADAEISEQTVALLQGRMDIQSQLVTLNQTRSSLSSTLSVVKPLWEQVTRLETTQSDLQTQIAALQDIKTRLAAADEALGAIIGDAAVDDVTTAVENLTDSDASGEMQLPSITESQEYIDAQAAVQAIEDELTAMGLDRVSLPVRIVTLQTEEAAAGAALSALDATLGTMDLTRDGLSEKITEMEDGVAQCDTAIETLNTTLTQLDSGATQLSTAMETLSSTKSDSLLQLADAAAQITVNSAALDTAMDQVEAGLDSVEDSREDALAQADISGKITLSTVTSILQAQNFQMPAGYVQEDGLSYMVSVGDEIEDIDELSDLLLFDTGEDAIGPVYLSDVADIFITDNSDDSYAGLNGDNAVILTIEKQSNAATADVCDAVNDKLQDLQEDYPGLHFVSLMSQGDYIRMIVNSILSSLATGAIFAVIVLILFLHDIRPTLITLLSIPVSVVFAIVLMYFSGITLNMISLSGLAVAVGMLVDNSIVVIENIYRLRGKGATAIQAAVQGTKQVAAAITSSTLTTVCVFLPIVFVTGLAKQLFTDLALTMGYSLMASLFIALTLVPAMAQGMLTDPKPDSRRAKRVQKRAERCAARGQTVIERGYRGSVLWAIRHKWIVLPLTLILLVGSGYLLLQRGFVYMPDIDLNTVTATLTMPEDADRDQAIDMAAEFMDRVMTLDNVQDVGVMMGSTSISSLASSGGTTGYDVTAYITLDEGESGLAAGQQITEMCADLACTVDCSTSSMNLDTLIGSGITVNVYGSDMEDLQNGAQQVSDALARVPGVSSVDNGLDEAEPALHITVDKNAAMAKGYTVAQIYMAVSEKLTTSSTVMSMDIDNSSADVLVEDGETVPLDELRALSFDYADSDGNTQSFALDDVADIDYTVGLASISREDQRRMIAVTAEIADGYNVTNVTTDARNYTDDLTLPDGVTFEYDGESEAIMDSVYQLLEMLALGIALVYFIMVAQFQSLKSPFIVMFTIPLAFTGGFLAMLIFGLEMSVVSLIGFVMLVGIIVNNGIVLVDYVNQLRISGMERRAALVEASATRLRPILMTSLTTIMGLIVMAMGHEVGTALMQPVAIVCIGGLLYATLMTLFVVPCIYDLVNRRELRAVKDEDMEFDEL